MTLAKQQFKFAKPPPRSREKRDRRRSHAEATADLRARVFARARGLCEICGDTATQMHHLDGGSGKRREKQAVGNCIALCSTDHWRCHNASAGVRVGLQTWAAMYGYDLPWRYAR